MQSLVSPTNRPEPDLSLQIKASVLLSPWATLASYLIDNHEWPVLIVASLALLALTFSVKKVPAGFGPYLISFCLVAHCVLFTIAFASHPWQIDTHMLYFAIIAIVATLQHIPALLFAAGVIAVHHLSMTVALPALVYPDGSVQGNLARTILHAVIVVLETGVLLFSIRDKHALERIVEKERQDAMEQAKIAEIAEEEAESQKEQSEEVVGLLTRTFSLLSDGDLTCAISTNFPEMHEPLRKDFNKTVNKLHSTIEQILHVAQSITGDANQISRSADDLSRRTEHQAATLEEATASLEDLSNRIREDVEKTRTAETRMRSAREDTERGSATVSDAVEAMAEIEKSSLQISQIIGVIEDIAFQTNLLALNAGVEAARAGSAGSGFAVVASEVRGLAQRSAESASEIKSLIQSSAQQVEKGAELVSQTGAALKTINSEVGDIATLISEITQGISQQSAGLEEINGGVATLDQVSQQNAAMVSESAGASHRLNREATELADLISSFTIEPSSATDTSKGTDHPKVA